MKLAAAGAPHLTYCTNIHAGESWAEIRANLEIHVKAVKAKVAPDRPFGVGLRLSGLAASELEAPGALEDLRDFLAREAMYVFTINGFPYGPFHHVRVKEEVYLPDWLDDERLAYTNRLASLLAGLLPDGVEGTVSTVPGAFKPRCARTEDAARIADRLLRHAAALARLEETTGKHVALAIEPEPFCQLETIAESVDFFEGHLFARDAVARFGERAGLGAGRAEEALRSYLGLCFDACHMAVEFEDLDDALGALRRSGIAIGKIQVSAGLEVRPSDRSASEVAADLERFAEGVYLHQVTEARSARLERWLDLPDALAVLRQRDRFDAPWRIHFHVPLFREELGPFHGTQPYLGALLDRVRTELVSPHLEVETYTWDVLPEEHRRVSVDDAVARELHWVLGRLGETP